MLPASGEFAWMIDLVIMLSLAKLSEVLAVKAGLPRVLGYILAGIALSAAGFRVGSVSYAFATIGIILMLFYVGLGETASEFLRGLRTAGLIAVGGVLGAIASGFAVSYIAGLGVKEAIALGVAYSATSVSLTVKTLEELGRLGSREGRAIMGAAVVDDVIGLALVGTMVGVIKGAVDIATITSSTVIAFTFWFAVAISFEYVSKPLLRLASLDIEEGVLAATFIILLLLSYIASFVKLSAILLAYALGLGLSSHRYLSRRISSKVYPLVAILTPLFFVYAGTLVNIQRVFSMEFLAKGYTIIALVLFFGFVSKVAGCYSMARVIGFNNLESLVIGFGMVPRAEVMLVTAAIALELGALSNTTYTSLLVFLVVSSVVTPPIIKAIYSKFKA